MEKDSNGIARSNFLKDRDEGRLAEQLFIDTVLRLGGWAVIGDGVESDVLFTFGKMKTAEVKLDRKALQTGNIAIEYHNPRSNKPSGLMNCSTDIWVIVLPDNTIWATPVTKLSTFFWAIPPYRDLKGIGDGNASIRLFKARDLLGPIFHPLHDKKNPPQFLID